MMRARLARVHPRPRRARLSGVRLVICDAHEGLKAAIPALLLGAAWQRGQSAIPAKRPDPDPEGQRRSMVLDAVAREQAQSRAA